MKDSASIAVALKPDDAVVCSDIANSDGVVIPQSKTDPYGNTSTITSATFLGPIHVTKCEGTFSGSLGTQRQIWFTVTGSSQMPAVEWVSALGGKVSFAAEGGVLSQIFIFDITSDIPTWMNPNEIMTAKLVPVE